MLTLSRLDETASSSEGLRPINLRTDLGQMADLIELVFAESMDSGGRAALREMRYLSRMGIGLNFLARMNDIAPGTSLGYVWIAEGKVVGNVSVYPANWPSDLGSAWIVANVGVHPDYRRRGIANKLIEASLGLIGRRGGNTALLQVDEHNIHAIRLYEQLGFVAERTWTTWRRSSATSFVPPRPEINAYIRHRRHTEWGDELRLAGNIRPQARGGLGWLRPLHKSQFRRGMWKQIVDWVNLHGVERLIIASESNQQILASLWIDNTFAGKTRLTLLVDPPWQGIYDDLLLHSIMHRFRRTGLTIEHPSDETVTNNVLANYLFHPQRRVIHMRWDMHKQPS